MGLKPKKCFVCGRIFVPNNGKQICCCESCSAEYKKENDRLYWDVINGGFFNKEVDDYIGSDVYISTETLNSAPSLVDKIQVKKLLTDFGVKCEVPDFETVRELNSWRQSKLGIIGH